MTVYETVKSLSNQVGSISHPVARSEQARTLPGSAAFFVGLIRQVIV